MLKKSKIFLLSFICWQANAADLPEPLESHHWPGEFHAVACSQSELSKVEAEIKSKIKIEVDEALQIVKSMLCTENNDEDFLLSKMSSNLLYVTSDEINDRIEKRIDRSKKHMVYKQAWQPFVFGSDLEVKISYRANRHCFHNFVIKHNESHWLITEIGVDGCG